MPAFRDPYPSGPDDPQRAGQDVAILQDGRVITYATGFSVDFDNALQRLNVIGRHGAIAIKSTDLIVRASGGTFLIMEADDPGAIGEIGWQSDGTSNINTGGYTSFSLMDIDQQIIALTLIEGKPGGGSYPNPAVGILEKSINFEFKRMAAGLSVSG